MKRVHSVLALVLASLSVAACSSDDDSTKTPTFGAAGQSAGGDAAGGDGSGGEGAVPAPLEIIGEYADNFGGEQTITADVWNDAKIVEYDNDDNVVYTQLPQDDAFNPNKFVKVVYTEPQNDSFYFCWVAFSLDTLKEAKDSTATADASKPDESGCGGFAWTRATKK